MNRRNNNNGQKPTSQIEKILFNTANGFAASGLDFMGPYQIVENHAVCKAILFPGGKWFGEEGITTFFEFGAKCALAMLRVDDSLPESDFSISRERMIGLCVHFLYEAELMKGNNPAHARIAVANMVVEDLPGFLSREKVLDILNHEFFVM